MKVHELIKRLQEFPEDMDVQYAGYDDFNSKLSQDIDVIGVKEVYYSEFYYCDCPTDDKTPAKTKNVRNVVFIC